MGKNSNNSNTNVNVSSKKDPTSHKHICCGSRPGSGPDLLRDVERLRAALNVERSRNQQMRRRFSLELRRQREEARQERERALKELTYRLEQQKALELLRQQERLGRERAGEVRRLLRWRGQEKQKRTQELAGEITGICSSSVEGRRRVLGCKGNEAAYRKLEDLLKTLFTQADGREVALLRRLQQEVDVEKRLFLCHLLETHNSPEDKDDQTESSVIKPKPRPRSKSCVHLLTGVGPQNDTESSALFRSHSLSPQTVKKQQQDSKTPPLNFSVKEEEPGKTNLSADLPQPCPSDEERGLQHPNLLETQRSPSSRCSEENMDDMVRLCLYSLIRYVVF